MNEMPSYHITNSKNILGYLHASFASQHFDTTKQFFLEKRKIAKTTLNNNCTKQELRYLSGCTKSLCARNPRGFYHQETIQQRCSSTTRVVTKRFRRFRKWCQFSRCNDETTSSFGAFSDTIRNTPLVRLFTDGKRDTILQPNKL